jgi:hypothetical protein
VKNHRAIEEFIAATRAAEHLSVDPSR